MRALATVVTAIVCAAAVSAHASPARELVTRLALMPDTPGGCIVGAPVYDLDAVPPATFSVYIDTELHGVDIETYLADRARLLTCHYAVWLYRFDDEEQAGPETFPGPTLVIGPDAGGGFPLTGPALVSGKTYAWQVVATVCDDAGTTATLWSAPLFFRTSPAEASTPELLIENTHKLATELLGLVSAQQRSQAAVSTTLRGLRLLNNYPTASDMYLCAPLTRDGSCPHPDHHSTPWLTVPRLKLLGNAMQDAAAVQQRLRNGEDALQEATDLGGRLHSLLDQWSRGNDPPGVDQIAPLVALTDRLQASEPRLGRDDALGALSELMLTVDELVGCGSVNLQPGYEESFITYAKAADERLCRLAELQPDLEAALGTEETMEWLDYFRSQRAGLALLVDEVGRGRLAKTQLVERLSAARHEQSLGAMKDAHYLEGATCRVNLSRIKRLTPEDEQQVAALGAEIVRCHLYRLASRVWPGIQ